MLEIIKRWTRKEQALAELPPAKVNRMTLEQRMAYRQEMLYQAVRESFLSMEVISSMYKFKVMPVDVRQHRFIVMIDVAKSFVSGGDARAKSFADLENRMRLYAHSHYGVLITGVYWRVSESAQQFEPQPRSTDESREAAALMRERQDPIGEVVEAGIGNPRLAREKFQPVSDEEAQAFREALRRGVTPGVLQVGNLEYQSDLAPLDDGIMIGGTQYGRLQ